MSAFAYPASFTPDDDERPVVSFPDFPEAHTDGRDMQEAMTEAIDCLGSTIAFRIADKADIPVPSKLKRGQRLVPVPLWIAGKLALYTAMKEQHVSNSELARRLEVRETVVRRMLDPNHATRADRLHAALWALGTVIFVSMDAAIEQMRNRPFFPKPAEDNKPGSDRLIDV